MATYLEDTADLIDTLIAMAFIEVEKHEAAREKLYVASVAYGDIHERAVFLEANPSLANGDTELLFRDQRMDALREYNRAEQSELKALYELNSRLVACNVLCGAVLQIAKQAISVKHGASKSASGRTITTSVDSDGVEHPVTIRDLILASRNQAMHYEEGVNNEVRRVFDALQKSHGCERFDFRLRKGVSNALTVINFIGWRDRQVRAIDLKNVAE